MPIPTIEQLRNVGDYATTYHWNLEIAKSPSVVALDNGLNLRCQTTEVPKSESEPMEIQVRGLSIKQHGIYKPTQSITLELFETVDNYVHSKIKAWREACWEVRTGAQHTMDEVKGDLLLQRYDNSRQKIIWTYKLIGVFLESYDVPQLGTDSDTLKPSITLSYDYYTEGEGSTAP